MHKILVETEFKFLQSIGYEVFRPPYLSDIVDQSVSQSDDFGNAVLPPEVRQRLSSCNFFGKSIASDVGELLTEYFDAVLVTINPDWLKLALKGYAGKVIYRCYGQLALVSKSLAYNGCKALIAGRDNFHYLPHAPECLDDEEPWLASQATVVPYWLTDDVFAFRGAWRQSDLTRRRSMALVCPNVTNPYYTAHFRYLKRFFEERCFRYYGVQIESNADPNIVGTLTRAEQLTRLCSEAGLLYTYRDKNVCYLPPIEMMTMGGPVLYFPGSLLARYFDGDAPGLVADEAEAVVQSKRLMRGDASLIDEIVDSQANVVHRYTPEYGESLFRLAIDRLLPLAQPAAIGRVPPVVAHPGKRVLLLAHNGENVVCGSQAGAAVGGIPCVMRQIVRALNGHGVPVSVSYAHGDPGEALRFYSANCRSPELVEAIDAADIVQLNELELYSSYGYAVVPHYKLYPEANALALPLLAYMPDYLPHFFQGRGWFDEVEQDIEFGRRLVKKARFVITSSAFSESYLPDTKLCVPQDKIKVIVVPFIDEKRPRSAGPPASVPPVLRSGLFVFYPTQADPHKRLDLLVIAWLLVNRDRQSQPIRLALTIEALPPRLVDLIAASRMSELVHLLPAIPDEAVDWLYANARCLAFSSELDGQFPTQVLNALSLDCPVVCTDNALIVSELGDLAYFFQVAPFGDVAAFADRMAFCIKHRDQVLRRQRLVKQQILDRFSYERFETNVIALHRLMTDVGKVDARRVDGQLEDAVANGGEFV